MPGGALIAEQSECAFQALNSKDFTLDLYSSGEYRRMLERSLGRIARWAKPE